MLHRYKLAALTLALAATATSVHASGEGESRFFVNAEAGGTQSDLHGLTDKNDSGYAISGGYRWLDTWGFEIGYVDLGTTKAMNYYGDNVTLKTRGITYGANFKFDIAPKWSIITRLGLFGSQTRAHVVNDNYHFTFSERATAANAYAGVGINYDVNEHVALGLNVTNYLAKAKGIIDGTNRLLMYSGSVEVRF